MKKPTILLSTILVLIALFVASCGKKDTTPAATCDIIFNDVTHRTADSVRWDYYDGSTPRIQAFIHDTAIVTIWPTAISGGTFTLVAQRLYWIFGYNTIYTVNSDGGTLTFTNTNGVLDGTFTAHGNVYSGTGPSPTKIDGTFHNVRQYNH